MFGRVETVFIGLSWTTGKGQLEGKHFLYFRKALSEN